MACAAQAVPAAEIHWSCPKGKPLSKYGWNLMARLRTCHDPSAIALQRRTRLVRPIRTLTAKPSQRARLWSRWPNLGLSAAADVAYRRGLGFLLSTQYADGSWHVRSRAIKFQPYFESGFPFGHDQWISAAGTAWAAQAIALSIGPPSVPAGHRASRPPDSR